MSSKSAIRKKEFEKREAKREAKKKEIDRVNKVLRDPDSTMEDLAKALGAFSGHKKD